MMVNESRFSSTVMLLALANFGEGCRLSGATYQIIPKSVSSVIKRHPIASKSLSLVAVSVIVGVALHNTLKRRVGSEPREVRFTDKLDSTISLVILAAYSGLLLTPAASLSGRRLDQVIHRLFKGNYSLQERKILVSAIWGSCALGVVGALSDFVAWQIRQLILGRRVLLN